MKEGDEAWAFYEREGFADAIEVGAGKLRQGVRHRTRAIEKLLQH